MRGQPAAGACGPAACGDGDGCDGGAVTCAHEGAACFFLWTGYPPA